MNSDDEREREELARLLEIGEFWDAHDLADYWNQTEPAEFDFDPKARHSLPTFPDAS